MDYYKMGKMIGLFQYRYCKNNISFIHSPSGILENPSADNKYKILIRKKNKPSLNIRSDKLKLCVIGLIRHFFREIVFSFPKKILIDEY
jgi:hypothetical protein